MNNALNFSPDFEGLVLGCIDANFASKYQVTRWKVLAESYTMHSFAPFFFPSFSNLKILAKNRQHFLANE